MKLGREDRKAWTYIHRPDETLQHLRNMNDLEIVDRLRLDEHCNCLESFRIRLLYRRHEPVPIFPNTKFVKSMISILGGIWVDLIFVELSTCFIMGYIDEALFGYEVVERLPSIVKEWRMIAEEQKKPLLFK